MSSPDVWGRVEYGGLSARLVPAARAAVAALAPEHGEDAIDVAAGDGSAARVLAEAGARVVAVDASPRMVEQGRAACADLEVQWRLGDATALPVDDAVVDLAVSSFGVMFAAPAPAVAELGRALRPGGRLAVTVWSADGFMGRMGRLIASYTGGPVGDIDAWARRDDTTAGLGRWCADAGLVDVDVTPMSLPWCFDGPAQMTDFMVEHSPLHAAARDAVGERADEMFTEIERLAAPDGGAVDLGAEYVLVTARKEKP